MAEDVAALSVRLEATAARFERDMNRAVRSMDRAAGRIEGRANRMNAALGRAGLADRGGGSSTVVLPMTKGLLGATAAVAGLGKVLSDTISSSDRLSELLGRFEALTGSAERAERKVAEIFRISSTTGAGFDGVASAMSRFTQALEGAEDVDDAKVARLVENVTKLGQIGGGSVTEVASGLQQLGQALASGVLQGDELRSLRENLPLVTEQIAKNLGVSVGHLKALGEEGKLTTKVVFDALLADAEAIDAKFEQLPQTVARATQNLSTAWTGFTAQLDETIGLSRILVDLLQTATALLNGTLGSTRAAVAATEADVRATSGGSAGAIRTDGGQTIGSVNRIGYDPQDPRAVGLDAARRGQAGRNPIVNLQELQRAAQGAADGNREVAQAAGQMEVASVRALAAISRSFAHTAGTADSLSDGLRQIGIQIAELAAQGLFGQGPAGGFFNSLFGVQDGGILGLFARGGVLQGGVRKYAAGGVVSRPTVFPMAKGVGLMGEAGPEAILPLARGRGGMLGVRATGGSGGAQPINIGPTTINITQPGASPQEIQRIVADSRRETIREIVTMNRRNPRVLGT